MQTINTNNLSFNGAFRLKPQHIKAQEEIPQLFTQGKQIFYNMLEKGDQVIVVRNSYDKRIYRYIENANLKDVEYYPNINTKSGLDDEIPEGLLKLLKDKSQKIITDLKEMAEISIKAKNIKPLQNPNSIDILNKVSESLRLNIEKPIISTTKASTIIRDNAKERTIEIIMPNKGTCYVHVKPDCLWGDHIRCIIDGKGKIVKYFETPKEMLDFKKKFSNLKSQNLNIVVKPTK